MTTKGTRTIQTVIAVLSILVGLYVKSVEHEGPCISDPAVDVRINDASTVIVDPCDCYSETYDSARSKFRSAARSAGATLHVLTVPVDGAEDGEYTIDVAILTGTDIDANGSGGGGLVIHTSGTHGAEGFAGSAVQISFLQHLASNKNKVRFKPTVVLIHAVNPHGMAHHRRTNENNVDLNRNALHKPEWFLALNRNPNVAHYDDFDETLFNPPRPPTLFDAYVRVWLQATYAIVKHGYVNMKQSMVAAQYHNPKGIFFGGMELQTSHRLIWDFLSSWLQDEEKRGKGTVTWIDVHTGLGPSGVDTLMADMTLHDDVERWFGTDTRFHERWFGTDTRIQAPMGKGAGKGQHGDVSAGYELTMGTIHTFYIDLFRSDNKEDSAGPPLIITEEFGTRSGLSVARAMILENMARHHGSGSYKGNWTDLTRDVFYVRTTKWRASILDRGLKALFRAIERSSSA